MTAATDVGENRPKLTDPEPTKAVDGFITPEWHRWELREAERRFAERRARTPATDAERAYALTPDEEQARADADARLAEGRARRQNAEAAYFAARSAERERTPATFSISGLFRGGQPVPGRAATLKAAREEWELAQEEEGRALVARTEVYAATDAARTIRRAQVLAAQEPEEVAE